MLNIINPRWSLTSEFAFMLLVAIIISALLQSSSWIELAHQAATVQRVFAWLKKTFSNVLKYKIIVNGIRRNRARMEVWVKGSFHLSALWVNGFSLEMNQIACSKYNWHCLKFNNIYVYVFVRTSVNVWRMVCNAYITWFSARRCEMNAQKPHKHQNEQSHNCRWCTQKPDYSQGLTKGNSSTKVFTTWSALPCGTGSIYFAYLIAFMWHEWQSLLA